MSIITHRAVGLLVFYLISQNVVTAMVSIYHPVQIQPLPKPKTSECLLPPREKYSSGIEKFTLSAGQKFRTKVGVEVITPQTLDKPVEFSISEFPLEKLFFYKGGLAASGLTPKNARAFKITASRDLSLDSKYPLLFKIDTPIECFLQEDVHYILPENFGPLLPAKFRMNIYGLDHNQIFYANEQYDRIYEKQDRLSGTWKITYFRKHGSIFLFFTNKQPKNSESISSLVLTDKINTAFGPKGLKLIAPQGAIPSRLEVKVELSDPFDLPYPHIAYRPIGPMYTLSWVSGESIYDQDLFLRLPLPKDVPLDHMGVQIGTGIEAQGFIDLQSQELVVRITSEGLNVPYTVVERKYSDNYHIYDWKGDKANKIVKSSIGILAKDSQTTMDGIQIWLQSNGKIVNSRTSFVLEEIDQNTLEFPIFQWYKPISKIYRLKVETQRDGSSIRWKFPMSIDFPESCFDLVYLGSGKGATDYYPPNAQYYWGESYDSPLEGRIYSTGSNISTMFFLSRKVLITGKKPPPECAKLYTDPPKSK
jgi:hypothetical protein